MNGQFLHAFRFVFEVIYFLSWLLIPHVIFKKKNPVSVLAWVWAILLFPIIGAVAYVVLGTNRISRKYLRRKAKARLASELEGYRAFSGKDFVSNHSLSAEARRQLLFMEKTAGRKPTAGNASKLLIDAAGFYGLLLDEIEKARHHVHLEFYIWRDDSTGKKFLDALARAAKRGIEVRLLVDEIGSMEVKSGFFKPLLKAGGHFSWFWSLHFLRHRFFINLRNHRKVAIIDGKVAYIGGMNIGMEYLGEDKKFGYWRDSQLRLEGPCVSQLQEVFADDWFFATDEKLLEPAYYPEQKTVGSQIVQVVEDGPDSESGPLHMTCLSLISRAEKKVWIETPYFVPYWPLILQLQMAALRGVDVRLFLSGKLDHPYLLFISRSYYEELLNAGVRIFEYQKGIMHSKLMVVDGVWSFAGSANMDIRSFRLNFEINVAVHDNEMAQKIEQLMISDLAQSKEIKLDKFQARSWLEHAKESVLRLLAPAV